MILRRDRFWLCFRAQTLQIIFAIVCEYVYENYFEYFKPCDIRNNLHSNRYALRENPSLGACASYLTKLLTQTYDYERTLQEVEFIISAIANAFIDSSGPRKSGVRYC